MFCRVQLFATPWTVPHWAPLSLGFFLFGGGILSPGKNTGVGHRAFLQGTFLIQESNMGLLHYRHILYHLSYQGNPLRS